MIQSVQSGRTIFTLSFFQWNFLFVNKTREYVVSYKPLFVVVCSGDSMIMSQFPLSPRGLIHGPDFTGYYGGICFCCEILDFR